MDSEPSRSRLASVSREWRAANRSSSGWRTRSNKPRRGAFLLRSREVNGQKSEAGDQRAEDEGQSTEVGSPSSEIRDPSPEVSEGAVVDGPMILELDAADVE